MSNKYDFWVLKPISKELDLLKGDIAKRFFWKSEKEKRKIDITILGAARAINLKQSLIEESRGKNSHDHILKDINKDISKPEDIIFLSQIMGYFSQLKKKTEDPHHIIFDINRCLNIARCYFESSWNLGSPTYQEILENSNNLEETIISELLDKIKNIEEVTSTEEVSMEQEEEENSD